MQTSIDEGIDEDSERQAKELIAKLAEYKPLAKIEELEEQNYNMIDGRMNNLPSKPRKIGGRISVLDRLHLKQAEIARRSGKSVPQMEAEEMERRRK